VTIWQRIQAKKSEIATRHERIEAVLGTADSDQDGLLTEEQQKEIEALENEIATIEEELKPLQAQADARTRAASRGEWLSSSAGTSVPPSRSMDRDDPGPSGDRSRGTGDQRTRIEFREQPLGIADFVRALYARVRPDIVEQSPRVQAAMQAGNFASGGFVVPPNYVPELIELLRPLVAVRQLGVTTAPLVNGSLTLPKLTEGLNAHYIGESVNIPPSEAEGTQLVFTARKLAALTPLSNELLMWSSPSANSIIQQDIVRALAQREDQAFLRSDGTSATPKGLKHWCPAAHKFDAAAGATPSLANVDRDLVKAITLVREANIQIQRGGWIMAPRVEGFLMSLRDGNGNKAYPEMDLGRLRGWPYVSSSNVPSNLGGGGNLSEIYFVAAEHLVVAEDPTIRLEASSTAAYHDGSSVVAAFSRDETVVRMIATNDFAPRHEQAIVVIEDVEWAA
jgi:HK97 family phage major capsid protein